MWGPRNGNRYDSHMLRESDLFNQLRALMLNDGYIFSLYNNPTYPQSHHLFVGYPNASYGTDEARWNMMILKVKKAVYWGYKKIVEQWKYLHII